MIRRLLTASLASGGIMLPEGYNQLGAMHGTIMVFLGVVPPPSAASATSSCPCGSARPTAFPKLNMASTGAFLGGVIMLVSFFLPGGAGVRLDVVTPLSVISFGQTAWLLGMIFLITSSLLGSVNFIVTIVQLRAKGLSWMRLPFFVPARHGVPAAAGVSTARSAGVMRLMDRLAGTSFFMPSRLVVGGPLEISGGGNAALAAPVLVPRPSRGLRPDSPAMGTSRK